jgi:hypothetical protein
MSLTIGQKVKAEILGVDLAIQEKLGEGGQGTVYLIDGDYAIWFKKGLLKGLQDNALFGHWIWLRFQTWSSLDI